MGFALVGLGIYLGFLSGPPLIGLAAEHVSMRTALGIVCAASALVAVGARRIPAVTPEPGRGHAL